MTIHYALAFPIYLFSIEPSFWQITYANLTLSDFFVRRKSKLGKICFLPCLAVGDILLSQAKVEHVLKTTKGTYKEKCR